MKKKLIYFCLAAFSAAGFVSCSDNDDPEKPGNPDPDPVLAVTGAYVLNQGSYYSLVEGQLNFINFENSTIDSKLFNNANGRSLGNTPQCGVAYGSKIYLGVYGSQTVEIISADDYKSVKQIKLENPAQGQQPRSMVAYGGKVYISMYDGYVARLDTVSMAIDASVKVGPNPEIMARVGEKLYVPNSDGMNSEYKYGETASVIDLKNFTAEPGTMNVPLNPTKFLTNGTSLFLISNGNYMDVTNGIYKVENGKCTKITDATYADIKGDTIYIINVIYGADGTSTYEYSLYDISAGKLSAWNITGVDAPGDIAIDPDDDVVLIPSFPIDNGYPSYVLPGYVYEFDTAGKLIKKYDAGVGPACIFFPTK